MDMEGSGSGGCDDPTCDSPAHFGVSAPDPQDVQGEEQFRKIEGMRFRALKAEGRIAEVEAQLEAARQREEKWQGLYEELFGEHVDTGWIHGWQFVKDAEARISALEAENAKLSDELKLVQDLADRAYAKVSALQRERDGLREFAHHDIGCDLVVHNNAKCSCGFAEAQALASGDRKEPE